MKIFVFNCIKIIILFDNHIKMLIIKICEKILDEGGELNMATVYVKDNESLDSAFRRWKRKCSNEGIIGDLKRHEFFEKPSVKRKKKAENARKRSYK